MMLLELLSGKGRTSAVLRDILPNTSLNDDPLSAEVPRDQQDSLSQFSINSSLSRLGLDLNCRDTWPCLGRFLLQSDRSPSSTLRCCLPALESVTLSVAQSVMINQYLVPSASTRRTRVVGRQCP